MITHKMNENFKYHSDKELNDLFKLWLSTDAEAEAAGYENEHLNSLSELRYKEYDNARKQNVFAVTADDENDYASTIAAFMEGTR